MKKLYSFSMGSVILASILLSGCGDAKKDVNNEKVFTVERGPLLNAKLIDNNGQLAIEVVQGRYVFINKVSYPVTATGGYIDINYNGKVDKGEVKNNIELQAFNGEVVTIATSLFAENAMQAIIKDDFNISSEVVESKTPFTSKKIEAFSNTVYAYMINNYMNSPSEISIQELKALTSTFNTTLEKYQVDNKIVAENEQEIVDTLSVDVVTDSEAVTIQNIINQKFLDNKKEHQQLFENIIGGFEIDTDDGNGSGIVKPPITGNASGTTLAGADPIVDENGNLVLDTDNGSGIVKPPNTGNASSTTFAGAGPVVDENGNLVLDTDNGSECTDIYTPVCASVEVECITVPCEKVEITYSNFCKLINDSRATFKYDGECL